MVRKIALYYTHYQCLGHTSRINALIQHLKGALSPKIEIVVFQGSLPQKFLSFPQEVKKIDLPHPFYSKKNFKESPRINFSKVAVRADFLLKKIKVFDPDIFLTEYFPFGHLASEYELLPVLRYLKKNKKTIYCSLGYPFFAQTQLKRIKFLLAFYDKIFLHTPPRLEFNYALKYLKDTKFGRQYQELFKDISGKVNSTGYVLPDQKSEHIKRPKNLRKALGAEGKHFVLVTRGGGAYYPKIISYAISAKRYFKDTVFVVVAGPATTKEEWQHFRELKDGYKGKDLILKRYVPDFSEYFREADVVVSTAGYNTSVMLMYYRKKAVVVPFKGYPGGLEFWEQSVRAQILRDYIGSHILDYDQLSLKLFRESIARKLTQQLPDIRMRSSWFKGGAQTAKAISDWSRGQKKSGIALRRSPIRA